MADAEATAVRTSVEEGREERGGRGGRESEQEEYDAVKEEYDAAKEGGSDKEIMVDTSVAISERRLGEGGGGG